MEDSVIATSVASVTSHFPEAENGFTSSLASTIASGAATVPLNSVAGYTNGEPVVFVVDPSEAAKKQTFTGIIDTAGVQVTSVVWTAGTNQSHSGGATVVDYATATHISMISKGIKVEHNQNGTHSNVTATSVTATTGTFTNVVISGSATSEGWSPASGTPSAIVNNGNRSYNLTWGASIASQRSAGMRNKYTRTVTAPTQSTSLNGTTQYYSKAAPAGMTFTDDFTVSAWVKLSSYQVGGIVTRYDGTNGYISNVTSSGQLSITIVAGGNQRVYTSYQSLPLNKWVHVAATLDASASTGTTYIDGVLVPGFITNVGAGLASFTQAGSLQIGAWNGTNFFAGKIAQAAVYSSILTAATIKASMNQTLTGSETSLISAYSFNGVITDQNTTNANNLTANGSAVATNTDTPFTQTQTGVTTGTTNYSITTAISSDGLTETVQVPEGDTLPTTGGISAVSYSTHKSPYGFPASRNKWTISTLVNTDLTVGTVSNTWTSGTTNGQFVINIPIGEWFTTYDLSHYTDNGGVVTIEHFASLSTSNNSETDITWRSWFRAADDSGGNAYLGSQHNKSGYLSISILTPYYPILKAVGAVGNQRYSLAGNQPSSVVAECAYL